MRAQLTALFTSCVLMVPAIAHAQQRMPHSNAGAIAGEIGVFPPQQDGMTSGLDVAGTFEHYMTSRNSLRLAVELAEPRVARETSDSTRMIRVGGDLVHNWEGGKVHPFVGAGLGAYFLQARDNGHSIGDTATRFGGDILGGVEVFTTKTFAIKGEARYHIVQNWNGYNPNGLALTVGVKGYF